MTPPRTDPYAALLSPEAIEAGVRAAYDRHNGHGAFDREKSARKTMGIEWPSATFQSLYDDARAVIEAAIAEAKRKGVVDAAE
jgi:hypothetical protein